MKTKKSKRGAKIFRKRSERRRSRPKSIDPHQAYGVEEFSAAIDVSRSKAFEVIKAGKVQTVTIPGTAHRKVPGFEIIRLLKASVDCATLG